MATIGVFGYGAVGALYALLAALLLTTWRGNRIGVYLVLASVVSVVWGFTLAAQSANVLVQPLFVASIEVLRSAAWILFLAQIASQLRVSRILREISVLLPAAIVVGIIVLAVIGSLDTALLDMIVISGGLIIALLGLVLIEQLYRNSAAELLWSIKPLVLGAGGIFVFDLFLYSQGALLGMIDATTWAARGIVNLFFIPMIAIAARRNTDWKLRIYVSRQVIFYSATLITVGLYLLLISLGGYLIVRYGGSWGSFAQIVFIVGAIIVLITLMLSSQLRAQLRVFLNKHFFHNKYDYRDEWLRLVATLAEFDRNAAPNIAIKAIAQIRTLDRLRKGAKR